MTYFAILTAFPFSFASLPGGIYQTDQSFSYIFFCYFKMHETYLFPSLLLSAMRSKENSTMKAKVGFLVEAYLRLTVSSPTYDSAGPVESTVT